MPLPKLKPCYIVWNERLQADIGLYINAHMVEYMCFNQRGDISTRNGSSLQLVDMFTYLGSCVSSTETDINMWLAKAWSAIDRLLVIWKSDLTDKMKRCFFQAAVVLILLVWMHYMDREKAWQQLHKNAASNIEWVLKAATRKAAAVLPLTTHHKNCQS